jgi:uncharacterized membrane protein YfcA
MTSSALIILIVLFLVTSMIGVITGSNSLITVPVMFQFGIDEKEAVATNMFGLAFMSIGATIPFVRAGKVDVRRLTPLIIITLIGSAIGALLVGLITGNSLKVIVTVAMFGMVAFSLYPRKRPNDMVTAESDNIGYTGNSVSAGQYWLGIAATFILAVYGGLYSGGYVTVLTVVFVSLLGMTYSGAVAATKLINVFSSTIAAAIFMWQGLVDYRLGIILAVTMFVGAYLGAHFVNRVSETLIRRVFVGTVLILAVKMIFDTYRNYS